MINIFDITSIRRRALDKPAHEAFDKLVRRASFVVQKRGIITLT